MVKLGLIGCLTIAFIISCCSLEIGAEEENTIYSYGVMTLFRDGSKNDANNQKDFCFTYPSKIYNLTIFSSKKYSVVNETGVDLCTTSTNNEGYEAPDSMFLMKSSSNCSLAHYINYTLDNSAKALMMISSRLGPYRMKENYNLDALTFITPQTFSQMNDLLSNSSKIKFYAIEEDNNNVFDLSMLVLWFVACFSVFLGAYYGPYREISIAQSEQEILDDSANSNESRNPLKLTAPLMLILVFFISATLLLLYFFYSYIVYFFIGIFCIASCRAIFDVLNQLCRFCKLHKILPKIRGISVYQVVIGAIAVVLPIIWFIFRHNYNMWVLQDILGVCFCINLIQVLRLPSLKVCTTLLSLLFFYDIFFVFITPYFTSDGKSVMVEVATGGDSTEMLPLLLKFPHMQTGFSGPLSVCASDGFSLLGFGDIIVPAFLVCFAHGFDIARGEKYLPYFITTFIGYCVGLSVAFVVLFISQTGQPALLYIVPSTLIPIYVAAIAKGQLRDIWEGTISVELTAAQ